MSCFLLFWLPLMLFLHHRIILIPYKTGRNYDFVEGLRRHPRKSLPFLLALLASLFLPDFTLLHLGLSLGCLLLFSCQHTSLVVGVRQHLLTERRGEHVQYHLGDFRAGVMQTERKAKFIRTFPRCSLSSTKPKIVQTEWNAK